MIKKMSLQEYRMSEFAPGSRPHLSTLRKRCLRGEYPNAVKDGRFWYLLVEVSTGDARADKILQKMRASSKAPQQ